MTIPASTPFGFTRKFNPVVPRHRHDGWTADRQRRFIEALAESGCVLDACRRVGMSSESAYTLRARYDAVDFRLTWEAALDYAVERLSDAALSRAIHGVPVPHYYKGEVVGEHRRYNESLTMFILRYRDPIRYARHWDRQAVVRGHSEAFAEKLALGLEAIREGASDGMHARQNAVLQAAADIVTDEEALDLCTTQEERGVLAAVEAAEALLERYTRAAEAAAAAAEKAAAGAAAGSATVKETIVSTDADHDPAPVESPDGAAFRSDSPSGSSTSDPDATPSDPPGPPDEGFDDPFGYLDPSPPAPEVVVSSADSPPPPLDVAKAAREARLPVADTPEMRTVTMPVQPHRPPWQAPWWAEKIN